MKNKLYFLFCLFLLSCASSSMTTQKKVYYGDVYINTELFYDLIPSQHKIVQLVHYKSEDREESAQVVFVKDKTIKVSVLSTMGIELLSLEMDRHLIREKVSFAGVKLDFFYRVMADMLVVYAPPELLIKSMEAKLSFKDTKLSRELYHLDKKLFKISYSSEKNWEGNVSLVQIPQNYKLEIKTLIYEHLY